MLNTNFKLEAPSKIESILGNSILCFDPVQLFSAELQGFKGYLGNCPIKGEFQLEKPQKSVQLFSFSSSEADFCTFGIFGSQDEILNILKLSFTSWSDNTDSFAAGISRM